MKSSSSVFIKAIVGTPSNIPKIPNNPPPRTIPRIISSGLIPTLSPIIFGDMNHPSILLKVTINSIISTDLTGLKNSVIIKQEPFL